MNTAKVLENVKAMGVLRLFVTVSFYGILITGFFLNLLIFPFYMYVYKKNKENDGTTPLSPVTNHFYKMVRTVYALPMCSIVIYILKTFIAVENPVIGDLLMDIIYVFLYIMYLIIQVYHLLIFLLAVGRFLLYFFPKTKETVLSAQNILQRKVKYIYALFIVKDFIFLLCLEIGNSIGSKRRVELAKNCYAAIFFSINLLIIISAILYIPIVRSVGKLAIVLSAKQSKPQKYILWQTMIVFIFKMVTSFVFIDFFLDKAAVTFELIPYIILTDIVITPLIIQISYLGFNKRNIGILLSTLKILPFSNCLARKTSTVHPMRRVIQ
ncbi:Serpentine Receptor, class Z [Caenorhabditis elegans]|uniref:Serpentine Receptor, class Z n=1 Tax=Caenorhabditis elegans TaxID=6239 RepID=O45615_CAEEL|nr:Serpentine Receptor, class Z [Caenorhabditis elegans]CAB11536.1 Serpentine Receptor, class Z [Caenorhabditis elegans]|eukprot:NP_502708.1 Serpentine Receptor, class Z [Caenorhabditis elegans]